MEIAPYLGKSIGAIPSVAYVIPAIDFGANFALNDTIDAGLRGQIGYLPRRRH